MHIFVPHGISEQGSRRGICGWITSFLGRKNVGEDADTLMTLRQARPLSKSTPSDQETHKSDA